HRPFCILCISRCQLRAICSMKAMITAIKNWECRMENDCGGAVFILAPPFLYSLHQPLSA
ncbi:hypothetical protein, partial [Dialister sp.]|uniref:hypothetical protein n=1 Tax=Dialister sp. TaxID=1955814 RepID=UPI003F0F58F1